MSECAALMASRAESTQAADRHRSTRGLSSRGTSSGNRRRKVRAVDRSHAEREARPLASTSVRADDRFTSARSRAASRSTATRDAHSLTLEVMDLFSNPDPCVLPRHAFRGVDHSYTRAAATTLAIVDQDSFDGRISPLLRKTSSQSIAQADMASRKVEISPFSHPSGFSLKSPEAALRNSERDCRSWTDCASC